MLVFLCLVPSFVLIGIWVVVRLMSKRKKRLAADAGPESMRLSALERWREGDPFLDRSSDSEETKLLRRKCEEYFHLIERLEKQREEWKEMYKVQSVEHQRGQALLEHALENTRLAARKLIATVNHYYIKDGRSPIKTPKDLEELAPPSGTADEYREQMKTLDSQVPEQIDAKAERDRIDQGAR